MEWWLTAVKVLWARKQRPEKRGTRQLQEGRKQGRVEV
jgi:hypothetical protein